MSGIIYILINEAMPGYVKLGKTTSSVQQRMRELDSTGVPLPFECFYAARVADCHQAEKLLHDAFQDQRVRSRREFFLISPERMASALKLAALEDVTPRDDVTDDADDEAALNEARQRRGRFSFGMVGLRAGTILTHVKNDKVTCVVVDDRNVEFQGDVMSLSQAALKVIHDMGYTWEAVQGPLYWQFEGQSLDSMRQAIN